MESFYKKIFLVQLYLHLFHEKIFIFNIYDADIYSLKDFNS